MFLSAFFTTRTQPRFFAATVGVAVVGVILRLVQWLGNASLWLDELSLLESVLGRNTLDLLTQGLSRSQVAPIGFLGLERLAVSLFGDGEMALRLVPLLASIGALIAFTALARNLLRPSGALVAAACFALNPLLISLGSVVKQYSTDVLVTVLLVVALRRLWTFEGSLRSRILIGAGAGLLGFFSIPSAMVSGAALVALTYQLWRIGAWRRGASAVFPIAVWGGLAGAGALWADFLLTAEVQDFMRSYWARSGAFAPPFWEYPTWILQRVDDRLLGALFFRPYVGDRNPAESALSLLMSARFVAVVGIVATFELIRRHGLGLAIVAICPFIAAVLLSRFQLYPIEARTSVFLVPLAILLLGSTADIAVQVIPGRVGWLRMGVPIGSVAVLGIILLNHLPVYSVQRPRELISELAERRMVDEPVFAHPWAGSAFLYYGPRFGVTSGVHVGSRGGVRALLTELETFRGEPSLWVVFTHPPRERSLILCYLNEVGRETERVVLTGGMPRLPVSLHRFDLRTSAEKPRVDAGTFPITDDVFEGDSPRCRTELRRDLTPFVPI